MNVNEYITWLDGYLKGIVDVISDSKVSFNVLSLELSRDDFLRSYLEFINNRSDSVLSDHKSPVLKISNKKEIKDWSEVVGINFKRLFGALSKLNTRTLDQTLDMLDMIVSESYYQGTYLSAGEIGDLSGDYLFFKGKNDEFLVISFLFSEKAY